MENLNEIESFPREFWDDAVYTVKVSCTSLRDGLLAARALQAGCRALDDFFASLADSVQDGCQALDGIELAE